MINKSEKNQSFLKVFLQTIYYLSLIEIILSIFVYFMFPRFIPNRPSVFMLLVSVVACCCGLAIVYELNKINDTVICKNPFVIDNVKRMQRIAIYLFIISVYVFIKDWMRFQAHVFSVTFDSTGLNTDAQCLIFVFIGVLVLILAKIFKTAIQIKNENDLTI